MDKEILVFLKNKVDLFRSFPDEKLKELADGADVITFEQNEAVIEYGEKGSFLGVLVEGGAEVSITDDGGRKHLIDTLKPGDIFGEMSLMTGNKTVADVVGLTHSRAVIIPQAVFSTVLAAHQPAVMFLSDIITRRMKNLGNNVYPDLTSAFLTRLDDPYGFKLKSQKPMKILVLNCGSSSLKYNLFSTEDESLNVHGMVEKIGESGTVHKYSGKDAETRTPLPAGGHKEAFEAMMAELIKTGTGVIKDAGEIGLVGHRVVHGGDQFGNSVIIDDNVEREIEALSDLAPLHNPVNLTGIREARKIFPSVPHVAVFDTSFHHTLPPYAFLYGLPYEYYENDKIRRYGFHGTSHAYVSLKAADYLKRPFNELEIVTCHLGNGASICAVDHGRSVDTSMGLTPLEGLLMGTRSGSVDPGVLTHILRKKGLDAAGLDALLNKQSGLLGISGVSNDMREIEKAANDGNLRAILAIKTFAYQIRKYIGSYMAAMAGLDVLVFTGGIGEGSTVVRSLACQGLSCMGIVLDEKKNRNVKFEDGVMEISAINSPIKVLAVHTNEELMIARDALKVVSRDYVTNILSTKEQAPIPIEVSAHHIHLSREHVDALFGKGYELTVASVLSQPGQYACNEMVNLVGPKGRIERVRVLGPERKETQVEIAMTEQYKLGIHPPIRESGDLNGSPGITVEGPKATITTDKGVICAHRHIHMSPEEALGLGLHDKDYVKVRVEGERELTFGDVLIRVNPNFRLAMHIDTDEANAANIQTGAKGTIEEIESRA